jgi:hypothetical protein
VATLSSLKLGKRTSQDFVQSPTARQPVLAAPVHVLFRWGEVFFKVISSLRSIREMVEHPILTSQLPLSATALTQLSKGQLQSQAVIFLTFV